MTRVVRETEQFSAVVLEELEQTVGQMIADSVRENLAEQRVAYGGEVPTWTLKTDGRARAPTLGNVEQARRRVEITFLAAGLQIAINFIERYIGAAIYRVTRRQTGRLGGVYVVYFNGREYPNLAAVPDLQAGDRASVWLTAEYAWIVNLLVKRGTGRGFAARVARTLRGRRELRGLYIRAVFRRNARFVGGFQPGWYFQISRLMADAQRQGPSRTDRNR